MNTINAHDVTARYLTAEHWRLRDEPFGLRNAATAEDRLVGFEPDVDAQDFREAMRERVQAFSPPLSPVQEQKGGEPLRGLLKELAEQYGLDGSEIAPVAVRVHAEAPGGAWDLDRLHIERRIARARADRSAHLGGRLASALAVLASIGRALPPRLPAEGPRVFVPRHHNA